VPLSGDYRLWPANRKIGAIRDVILRESLQLHTGTDCPVCLAATRELEPRIGQKPISYARKLGGVWVPKPREEAQRLLRNEVREIHAYMSGAPGVPTPQEAPEAAEEPEAPEAPQEPREAPQTPSQPSALAAECEAFYAGIQHRRAFVRTRPKMESLDSMRIVIDGVNAICQGIPKEALYSAIEAPWPTETRNQCANFMPRPSDLKPSLPEGSYDYAAFAPRPSRFAHAVSEYVLKLAAANVPVWLHGPAGTGKSSAATYAAEQLGLDYFEVNLAGAMVSAVKGKDRLKEFIESEAMVAFERGGLLCLEEFDSAHPSVGTALNTMLAVKVGGTYSNDAAGKKYVRHPNFRVIVTANSLGYGSVEFKRNDLDGATKDRFRIGRTYVGLDIELERTIFDGLVAA
jgi:hypothetical protein